MSLNRTCFKQEMFITKHVSQQDMLLKNKIVCKSEGYFDAIQITFHCFKQDSCTKMALN